MKVVVADTGVIISLVHIGQLHLIEKIFGDFYITEAVWLELNRYDNPDLILHLFRKLNQKLFKYIPKTIFHW